jgi:hypothetical protein
VLSKLRPRLTLENVMATIAVFVALGGTGAWATHELILSSDIVNGEVKTQDLANLGVTTPKLANGSVTNSKLANSSVTATRLATGAVTNAKLAANAVTGTKVLDNSLTGADVNESALDATPLRTRVGQGGCQGNDAQDIMVKVGSLCVDKYEASLWTSPTGGTQITGEVPCSVYGQDCTNIFARSVAGVAPRGTVTYFQAQEALANSGKRLLTNAEWQMAVAGTPDSTACNVVGTAPQKNTGASPGCISNHNVSDMVGNLAEIVADWVPVPTTCPNWGSFSDDLMCLSGASTTDQSAAALVRGGWREDSSVGPFSVDYLQLRHDHSDYGFRGAR